MSYVTSDLKEDEDKFGLDALLQDAVLDEWKEEEEVKEDVALDRDRRYVTEGVLERDLNDEEHRVHILELPVRKWTRDYKNFLLSLMESNH